MSGFRYNNVNGVGYYTVDEFENTLAVKTCFSTRLGGISSGPYAWLNLGLKTDDSKENIHSNFDILCDAAGFSKEDLVASDQVHGDVIRCVDSSDRGKGIVVPSDIWGVDALITDNKDAALCIFTADCVPVFIMDAADGVIALCHAGWRGIINNIVPKTVNMMCSKYGCHTGNIMAAIAPSIGPCCFDVGEDVASQFIEAFGNTDNIIVYGGSSIRINLWSAVETQLMSAGIKNKIINSGLCTYCCGMFYSYRRDGSATGRMASIMQLV